MTGANHYAVDNSTQWTARESPCCCATRAGSAGAMRSDQAAVADSGAVPSHAEGVTAGGDKTESTTAVAELAEMELRTPASGVASQGI